MPTTVAKAKRMVDLDTKIEVARQLLQVSTPIVKKVDLGAYDNLVTQTGFTDALQIQEFDRLLKSNIRTRMQAMQTELQDLLAE